MWNITIQFIKTDKELFLENVTSAQIISPYCGIEPHTITDFKSFRAYRGFVYDFYLESGIIRTINGEDILFLHCEYRPFVENLIQPTHGV